MKTFCLPLLMIALMTQTLLAQQFTPPALPPGVKGAGERAEGEVTKVYSMEDQGAKFHAYAVKYKNSEVIVDDKMATSNHKVGDKIGFIVTRVEVPSKLGNFHIMSFQILNLPMMPKKQ